MNFSVAGTWKSSEFGVTKAASFLAKGMSALDAVEIGVKVVEEDPRSANVGVGGYPNLHGECELDAAIMCGATLSTGAVLGLKGFSNPISIARRLMEVTPHTIISGIGADTFALEQGFKKNPVFYPDTYKRWFAMRNKYLVEGIKFPPLDTCTAGKFEDADEVLNGNEGTHDTVGMIAIDSKGNLAAATSTSGLALKIPGRIGDSPIIGSGFYADNAGGAATATGVGEDIMRSCMSYLAVQFMIDGLSTQEAAEKTMARAHSRLAQVRGGDHAVGKMAIICMDNKGNLGSAANHDSFYMYYAKSNETLQLFCAPQIR